MVWYIISDGSRLFLRGCRIGESIEDVLTSPDSNGNASNGKTIPKTTTNEKSRINDFPTR